MQGLFGGWPTSRDSERGRRPVNEPSVEDSGIRVRLSRRDADWCEAYLKGDVFSELKADPSLKDLQSRDFDVLEDLTKATQPRLAIV